MNRRDFFATAGAVAAIGVGTAMAAEKHDHHYGGSMHGKLIETASNCITTGQACIQHCFESFAAGDTSLAACAKTVTEAIYVCQTLQAMAAANSPHLKAMSKIALAVCLDCEKECRKHEAKHQTCKACAEACKACADECKKLGA
jgi:Cys-rich four helix bundle protein (predicted Tat secretion target)